MVKVEPTPDKDSCDVAETVGNIVIPFIKVIGVVKQPVIDGMIWSVDAGAFDHVIFIIALKYQIPIFWRTILLVLIIGVP